MPDQFDYEELFEGLDGPRPLPSDLADRLTATLAPTAVPRPLRRHIERVLIPTSSVWARPAVLAAAAVILVLLAVSVPLVNRDASSGRDSDEVATRAPRTSTSLEPVATPGVVGSAGAEPRSTAGQATGRVPAGAAAAKSKSLPPFAVRADDNYRSKESAPAAASAQRAEGDSSSTAGGGAQPAAQPTGPAARIGIIGGDPAQERGFRAYVEVANASGGLSGRPIELVASGTGSPASGVLVTVNLSEGQATGWRGGPLVETMNVTEAALRGEVFGLAGSAERQAHLAADAAFPSMSPGSTAVIYVGGVGAWSTTVPDAFESVLRSRGVSVTRVAIEKDQTIVLAPADAAFLSLDPKRVFRFADASGDNRYRPRLGVWGIWSTYADGTRMPPGTKALSPWQPPTSNEARAMAEYAPGPLSAALLHGWAVAKSVAVALDNFDADTPAEATEGLRLLDRYDSFLAPPYEFRRSTTARTPDARLFELTDGDFIPRGEWRRDPR